MTASPKRTRIVATLLAVAAAVLGLVVAGTPAFASTRVTGSRPAWLPVHTAFGLDCAGNNPGCTSTRDFYSVDVVPSGQFGKDGHPSHAGVFAMGGGVVHIGEAHGSTCGSGARTSFGTWIWIDHGNGVKSRYGHLSSIAVRNGAHVSAGQLIGTVGTTGKAKNCSVNYLDFEVVHGKLNNDNAYRFDSLVACTPSGTRQVWPAQASSTRALGDTRPARYRTWNAVPHGTQFPASSGSCI